MNTSSRPILFSTLCQMLLASALFLAGTALAHAQGVTLRKLTILNSDSGTTSDVATLGINAPNTIQTSGTFWWSSSSTSANSSFAASYGGTNGIQPSLVRYPGGSLSEYWDWESGTVLPNDSNLKLTPLLLTTGTGGASAGGSSVFSGSAQPLTLPVFKKAFVDTSTAVNVLWVLNVLTYSTDSSKQLSNGQPWSTDPVQYQVDLLISALQQGLAVKYIELGNEFYLNGASDFGTAFDNPTGVASPHNRGYNYANICKYWIAQIQSKLTAAGYGTVASNLEFALVGFGRETSPLTSTWNTDVKAGIKASATANIVPTWTYGPASTFNLTFHNYYSAGFGNHIINPPATGTYPSIPVDFSSYSGTNWIPQILAVPFINWGSLKALGSPSGAGTFTDLTNQGVNNLVNTYLPSDGKAWFTEYNLDDTSVPIHGTWLQGLYDALLTLLPFENVHTRFTTNFTAMGTAIWGEIMANCVGNSGNAMGFGSMTSTTTDRTYLRPYQHTPLATNYGLSPGGQVERLILDAARGMVRAQQINFPNDPDKSSPPLPSASISYSSPTTDYLYPMLYGFRFTNATSSPSIVSVIVLNLSDAALIVDMTAAIPGGGTFRVRESMGPQAAYHPVSGGIYYPAYYPGVYLYGSVSPGTTTPVELSGTINRTGPADQPATVTFQPYSITELYWSR